MASQIVVRQLRKQYRVPKRSGGLGAAFRALFRRDYELVNAVDGVSFDIEVGERVGFLGPNGAGKTTTLKMLAGLLYPTSGDVSVNGHRPQRRKAAFLEQIMLVMGQKQQLIWDLPPVDTFELNRAIYQVPDDQYKRTVGDLVQLLELGDLVHKPTRQLSLGERMKCELVAALIHQPRVLFLDEPTIGLDVTTQSTVREFIRDYNERYGATLILTSHYMEDVAALCPRVIVINKGRLSYDGSLKELVHEVKPEKRLQVRLRDPVDQERLERIGTVVERLDHEVTWQLPQSGLSRAVTVALDELDVIDFTVTAAPLEEVMSELFRKNTDEQE